MIQGLHGPRSVRLRCLELQHGLAKCKPKVWGVVGSTVEVLGYYHRNYSNNFGFIGLRSLEAPTLQIQGLHSLGFQGVLRSLGIDKIPFCPVKPRVLGSRVQGCTGIYDIFWFKLLRPLLDPSRWSSVMLLGLNHGI